MRGGVTGNAESLIEVGGTFKARFVNEARIEVKLQDLTSIPDGFFQSACQQACPSDAIVFGDILDDASRVTAMRDNGRSYMLLGFLNTRPRTTYLVDMKNPNPHLVSADRSFAQEGDVPITRLPNTDDEMEPYDVIIIGDVASDYFSRTQLQMISHHVSNRGAGLLYVGGGQSMPVSSWACLNVGA